MKAENPASKRKGGGGTLDRSEIVTVRLDPRLRYLVGLAARKGRRTVSSYIESVLEDSLHQVILSEGNEGPNDEPKTLKGEAGRLWDADGSERFVKLAIHWPDLLVYEEQKIWKALLDSGYLDLARKRHETSRQIEWDWVLLEDTICPALRLEWHGLLQSVTDGKSKEWIAAMQAKLDKGRTVARKGVKSTPLDRKSHV